MNQPHDVDQEARDHFRFRLSLGSLTQEGAQQMWGDPYTVSISARAERDLGRLPEKIAAACVEFIFGPLADNPYRLGGALGGQLAGLRSARRGSYRIIYSVDDRARRVGVVHIDHRGDVYR